MRVMVLAAGLGERLMPLTGVRPKCLMPVMNRPLLGLWLGKFNSLGVERAVINTHHLEGEVKKWLAKFRPAVMEVITSHEKTLLGTGGGIVNARLYFNEEPFAVVNSDVLATADISGLMRAREEAGALGLLGLVDFPEINSVAVDRDGRVLGFKGDSGLPRDVRWLTFSGISSFSPGIFNYLPESGPSSLIDGLRKALASGEKILGEEISGYWNDLGSWKRLWELHRALVLDPPPELVHLHPNNPFLVANGGRIHPEARATGFMVLDQNAQVEAGATVEDCVLLAGARVAQGAVVRRAVLGDGFVARGELSDGAFA